MEYNFLKYYYDHTYNVKKQFTPNKIILLSCILFLVSSIYALYKGIYVLSIIYFAVFVSSTCGDYIFPYSVWNVIDRWIVTLVLIILNLYVYYNTNWNIIKIIFIDAILIINIYYSRNSTTNKEYNDRHVVWHLLLFIIALLLIKNVKLNILYT